MVSLWQQYSHQPAKSIRGTGIAINMAVLPQPAMSGSWFSEHKLLVDKFDIARWATPPLPDYLRYLCLDPEEILPRFNIENPETTLVINPDATDYLYKKIKAIEDKFLGLPDRTLPGYRFVTAANYLCPGDVHLFQTMTSQIGGTPRADLHMKHQTIATKLWGQAILNFFSPTTAWAQSASPETGFFTSQGTCIKPCSLDRRATDTLFQNLALPRDATVFAQADFDNSIWSFVFFHELAHLTSKAQNQTQPLYTEFECDRLALDVTTSLFPERTTLTADILALRSASFSGQENDPIAVALNIDRSQRYALSLLHDPFTRISDPELIKLTEQDLAGLFDISEKKTKDRPYILQKSVDSMAEYLPLNRRISLKRRVELFNWAHSYLRHGRPEQPYLHLDPAKLSV